MSSSVPSNRPRYDLALDTVEITRPQKIKHPGLVVLVAALALCVLAAIVARLFGVVAVPLPTWLIALGTVALLAAALWETRHLAREQARLEKVQAELAEDIAVRRLVEEALRERSQSVTLLQRVAVAANEATDAEEAIQACLEEVCAMTGFPVGHAYLVDDADNALVSTKLWFLEPPELFDTFRRLTEHTHLRHGLGLPGRVLESARPLWINDVTRDALFRRMPEDGEPGVRCAFAFPVMMGKNVAAVLEFFSPTAVDFDPTLLELMTYVGAQLGRVLERQRAERTLRESEQRYHSLAQVSPVGIYQTDREGNCLFVNDQWGEITGLGAEESLGDGWYTALHPAARQDALERWRRFLESTQSHPSRARSGSLELRLQRPDGGERWVFNQVAAECDTDGRILGYVGTITDITRRKEEEEERRRLEAQVLHAQKLESLGLLAGGIAHDFNNLLVGILGNIGLVLADAEGDDPRRPIFQEIEKAAQRAGDLAGQMLAYSGRGTFVVEEVDLNELVREMVHLLEASISKKAALSLHFAAELPFIRADATQIRQVVMNLITNASEALEDQEGTISLRTELVELTREQLGKAYLGDERAPGAYVALEITDNGCGMDTRTRTKLFDPFFTTKATGRGLGMATLLGIVRGHQGAIVVRSALGRGATFRILFPAGAAARLRPEAMPASEQPRADFWRGHGTILVVDDEDAVRRIAERILRRSGFEVLQAEDGRQALEIWNEHNAVIVAVLLDMTMPHLDGVETYHELRRRGARIPVIFSSGYNEQDAVHRLRDEGTIFFVQKPYRPKDLMREVEAALGDGIG